MGGDGPEGSGMVEDTIIPKSKQKVTKGTQLRKKKGNEKDLS